jgi:hypothetical protein
MIGYKATDKDGKCRDFTFKVGKTYKQSGNLKICENGFHFCGNILDVYNYYPRSVDTRIFKVQALSDVQTEGDKSVTLTLKVLEELTEKEILNIWINKNNSGDRNSGDWNSGNRNSGDWNSGYGNSGNRNSGYGNSGDWNSGYGNSGDGNSGDGNSGYGNSGNRNSGYGNSGNRNSGDWNSGDGNSGYGNSGNRNSGDWNSGYGNSGYFNTEIPLYFFNKPSTILYTKELENKLRNLNVKPILTYTYSAEMTEQEKNDNPSHKTTGGFLRKTQRMNWNFLTEEDKSLILSLPNYDDDIFEKISGIRLLIPKTIKITVNGVEKELEYSKAKELGLVD